MNKLFLVVFFILLNSAQSYSQPQQSFCRHGLNVVINQNNFTRDSMLVSIGSGCIVTDVNVVIDTILHTWDSDLNIYLQKGPAGSLFINHVGGSGDNFIHTVLNDSAANPITSGTAPFTGTYRPSNPLTPFNGISPDGYWRMLLTDTATGDTGILKAWCLQITVTCPTGGIQTVEIPNTYRLYQNYPNPFNPQTTIRYGIPKNSFVKLAVFNELGEEIAILENGYKSANTYEAVFDASNLPSGVYYYKLEAEGFTDTKKMVIIK